MLALEVQLRIIDLAWDWVLKSRGGSDIPPIESIKEMARRFDEAYSSIYETIREK
jgi:hypothetical protein